VMVRLYSHKPPSGRCLLLAEKLHQVSRLSGPSSVHLAQRLFDFQHRVESPAIVEVPDASLMSQLEAVCADLGIVAESVVENTVYATNVE
jgi:hypothetical protein